MWSKIYSPLLLCQATEGHKTPVVVLASLGGLLWYSFEHLSGFPARVIISHNSLIQIDASIISPLCKTVWLAPLVLFMRRRLVVVIVVGLVCSGLAVIVRRLNFTSKRPYFSSANKIKAGTSWLL